MINLFLHFPKKINVVKVIVGDEHLVLRGNEPCRDRTDNLSACSPPIWLVVGMFSLFSQHIVSFIH